MPGRHVEIPFESYRGEAPFIFVSYAHKDKATVFPEIRRLHDAGYRLPYINPAHRNFAALHCRVDVQFYALMSLAKIGRRRHLGLLVDWWLEATGQRDRIAIGQALCRLLRLADYSL